MVGGEEFLWLVFELMQTDYITIVIIVSIYWDSPDFNIGESNVLSRNVVKDFTSKDLDFYQ